MQIYWKAFAYNGTLKLCLKSVNIFLATWLHQFNCETASSIQRFYIIKPFYNGEGYILINYLKKEEEDIHKFIIHIHT